VDCAGSAAFLAANSLKEAFSRAFVLSIMVASPFGVLSCSSESLSSATVGVGDASLSAPFGNGFFASSMLKPGGGPLSEPCVLVSVA